MIPTRILFLLLACLALVRAFLPTLHRPFATAVTKNPPKPAFVVVRSSKGDEDDDEEDVDVPDDWSEEDLLAEFGDDDGDEDVDSDETVALVDDELVVDDDEEEDDDDDDIDIDLDEEEDDDEDLVEEGFDEESLIAAADDLLELDEEEDESEYDEIEDDPDDPDYMTQKQLVEAAIEASQQRAEDEAFDPMDYIANEMTEEQAAMFDELPITQEVEKIMARMQLTEMDMDGMNIEEELKKVPHLVDDDPYPRHGADEVNFLEDSIGVTDEDMEALDTAYKSINELEATGPEDQVLWKDRNGGWDSLSNQTLAEMEACLDEVGGSSYNVTRWLLYDLDFNVTNLLLAAVKHNRDAPVLLQHWYPQLVTYERYKEVRDRNFDFSWADVENADLDELQRYYAGFGYNEIPKKAPAETGVIGLEDLDEEEIKMAAFDHWMKEVYNAEWDRKDFDDDDMQDEDNVFSEFFDPPPHPDLPSFDDINEDMQEWHEEIGDNPEAQEYRDMVARTDEYTVVKDEEFEREFRGHLVVACSPLDSDLEVAERITERFEKEFGKKIFVETRVMALAREDDNVFEIWLESYEIELLHSKKRATSNTKDWTGPAEVDENQINFLVDRVQFLISDDARYSYVMAMEEAG